MKTRKFYQLAYTKATGNEGLLNVKARNENEAIANAKDNCFTGSNFKVIREIEPTQNTIKGGGSHRLNN